ncbi:MAG: TlpA family protein disulfide reductase [Candidatus Fermentibacteraceae bacterium]|nr:TlpA family protein disulfide reductase [Candidatus Fermentibacteraceae bacterium]MBN2608960.1 TlpA family protein disulfide reductase [Candidatus Fermentibacteraceae bacterium]
MRYGRLADYVWILMVALLLYPVFRYGAVDAPPAEPVEQGPLLAGRASLDSLLAGSGGMPVIINFWATWCTPCVGELPHIDHLYRSMDGTIAAVAVDIGDPRLETLLSFREELTLSMPVVWLSQSEASRLKTEWELPDVLPVSIILDCDGSELVRVAGVRDESFFREALSGSFTRDTTATDVDDLELHINLVGIEGDSLTQALYQACVELAGQGGVDVFYPSIPADSARMEDLYLPFAGLPYAQPCIGSACGRLARTPEDLVTVVGSLSN